MGWKLPEYKEGDIIGDNIIFICPSGRDKRNRLMCEFECPCGNRFVNLLSPVKSGYKSNCGCGVKLKSDRKPTLKEVDGYFIWCNIKDRCQNKNAKAYPRYGKRGIKICDRWLDKENGFQNFLEDMGERPSKEYSLDRIDNDGNYEPENCRWATSTEQNRNTRKNVYLQYKEESKCFSEWAEVLKLPTSTLRNCLIKFSWDLSKCIDYFKSKGRIYSEF